MERLSDGLERIDESHLPGKLKVWCYQFTLYQRSIWPLKLCEITTSTVLRMDAKANKWLGLPWSLSNIGLFRKNALQLPLKSINMGYREEKAMLMLELRDSTDLFVKNTKAPV